MTIHQPCCLLTPHSLPLSWSRLCPSSDQCPLLDLPVQGPSIPPISLCTPFKAPITTGNDPVIRPVTGTPSPHWAVSPTRVSPGLSQSWLCPQHCPGQAHRRCSVHLVGCANGSPCQLPPHLPAPASPPATVLHGVTRSWLKDNHPPKNYHSFH